MASKKTTAKKKAVKKPAKKLVKKAAAKKPVKKASAKKLAVKKVTSKKAKPADVFVPAVSTNPGVTVKSVDDSAPAEVKVPKAVPVLKDGVVTMNPVDDDDECEF